MAEVLRAILSTRPISGFLADDRCARARRSMPPRSPAVAADTRAACLRSRNADALQSRAGARRPNRWCWPGGSLLRNLLPGLRPLPAGLVMTLAVVFLLGLLTTGTVSVSASAIPGQFLYPVKLAAEQVRLHLAVDPATHSAVAAISTRTAATRRARYLRCIVRWIAWTLPGWWRPCSLANGPSPVCQC